jgi:actin-related protein
MYIETNVSGKLIDDALIQIVPEVKELSIWDIQEIKTAIISLKEGRQCTFTWKTREQKIIISYHVGNQIANVLFDESAREGYLCPLHLAILDTILAAPIDLRRPLSSNIVLHGGSAIIPGIHDVLWKHLEESIKNKPKYACLLGLLSSLHITRSIYCPQILAWVGGSLVGGSKLPMVYETELSDHVMLMDWTRPVL